ncbi:MAG: 16S rRNA (uracil(1498)-N(3))-methyltransferase [Tepidanaerobacteraceae bacterium]|jgi:16S rRNA (uracil1498-N3)-methyltransferase|nr:16S rRNA (uracil(1498)-N(3))-methyltransferase [Tepidanaerobacter sp.]HQA60249.1 16S rRNA (uracil(1498)-N(3))-methyltransferase [Tepidanaerobacteraceae bacterium]HQE05224.1 16S rRNA (uracil(1498)-N(3))-methyltransferase [Tepidanaerobacteraceae bacterium]
MPRLFVFEKLAIGDEIVIAGEEAHHIIRVLRLGPGHSVSISDGKSVESLGVISDIDIRDTKIKIRILDQNKSKETKPFITLLQALPKGEKFDWIIQKSTELGVSKIIPVITQRTIVNILPSKLERRMERWNKIAIEAAKQSLRMDIPQIGELSTFDASLREVEKHHLSIIPWEQEKELSIRKALKSIDGTVTKVAVFIGPEGGFSPEEVKKAKEMGAVSVSLGPRILRTETAAIAVCSILMYELGGMEG